MPRTIVYIGNGLPDRTAGALRIMANVKALQAGGYNVVLINEMDKTNNRLNPTHIQGFETYNILYPSSAFEWFKRLISASDFIRVIKQLTDIEAVIIYGPTAGSLLSLRKYCKKCGIKTLIDCVEWHSTAHLHGLKKFIKSIDVFINMRYAQKKADGIILISNYLRNYYKHNKTLRVHPLIDRSDKKWPARTKHTYGDGLLRFVYAGSMGNDKDEISRIIETLSKYKDYQFQFEIIGISNKEFISHHPHLNEILKQLSSKIFFLGRLPHELTLQHIANADFSFLIRRPTLKNNAGFPTKLGESLACATPVIANRFSDIAEVIDGEYMGILIETVDDLPMAVEKTFNLSRAKIETMKDNAYHCNTFDYRSYIVPLKNFITSC